jgi:uncharacterized repeat protein (TIGR01451 family)
MPGVRVLVPWQVAPDVSITKSIPSAAVPLGSVVTYNITLRNNGSAPASNVTMVDVLPPGLQFDPSWTPPSGACGPLHSAEQRCIINRSHMHDCARAA